jgi:hypothetical protein
MHENFPVWELWFSYGKDTPVFDGISYITFFSIYIISRMPPVFAANALGIAAKILFICHPERSRGTNEKIAAQARRLSSGSSQAKAQGAKIN